MLVKPIIRIIWIQLSALRIMANGLSSPILSVAQKVLTVILVINTQTSSIISYLLTSFFYQQKRVIRQKSDSFSYPEQHVLLS